MADVKLVIKMPEKDYIYIAKKHCLPSCDDRTLRKIYYEMISSSTQLPKGHGRLIDKDHMIARLEAASKFYGGENADAFDERFSYGLKEAAIKVAEEPTIIEADAKGEVNNEKEI